MRHPSEVAKPPKSRRRGRQSGEIFRPEHLAELTTPSAPFSERVQFVNGASTPLLQGGECACAEYVICSVISKPEKSSMKPGIFWCLVVVPYHCESLRSNGGCNCHAWKQRCEHTFSHAVCRALSYSDSACQDQGAGANGDQFGCLLDAGSRRFCLGDCRWQCANRGWLCAR